MATHDYVIANASGSSVRSDINNALAAIVSNNSSSSEPSTQYAYQIWADTNSGYLKIRNAANNAWVQLFKLDGTDLANICRLTGSTNNTITTVTGANAIQGEANLTFDGANLGITAANDTAKLTFLRTSTTIGGTINTRDESGDKGLTYIAQDGNSGVPNHVFSVNNGSVISEVFRIQANKNVKIKDGNLIIDTAGHGIDFSAQTSTSATGAQVSGAGHEILTHYEEGQWTPTPDGTGQSYSFQTGRYTRIGNTVFFWFDVSWTGMTGSLTDGRITGLPFTSTSLTTQGGYGAPSLRAATGLESDIRVYGNSSYIGGSYIQLQHYQSSGAVALTDFLASGRVSGEGFYFTNNAY